LEQERMSLSVALAQKKLLRKSDTESDTTPQKVTTAHHTNITTVKKKVTTVLATDLESDTDSKNITPIDIMAKREKIKDCIIEAVKSGKRINYKKVATDAGVSYGMVQKHKEDILKEISQEMPVVVNE
jgi:hypothetical protein